MGRAELSRAEAAELQGTLVKLENELAALEESDGKNAEQAAD